MSAIVENEAAAIERLQAYRADPVLFAKQECGFTPDNWQGDILSAFPNHQRLALQACVGPGKTAVLALLGWNFIATRPLPKIACTSITWPNLRDNLWAEFAKWQANSPLLSQMFTWTQTRIVLNENPKQCWIAARTWDRSADSEQQGKTLSGLHADYIMAIADETGGMPPSIVQAAEGILSSCIEGKILQAGNPTHLAGALHAAVVDGAHLWHIIRISGDPEDPNRAPRVSVEWADEMIRLFGRGSGVVRGKVLGKFPKQASDALIGLHHWEDAFTRAENGAVARGYKVLGVDVARLGSDLTVVCLRDGDVLDSFHEWGGQRLDFTVGKVADLAVELKVDAIAIDDIGVGGGVTDQLRALRDDKLRGIRVIGINVGNASKVTKKGKPVYANLKAEFNLGMRRRFEDGTIIVSQNLADHRVVRQSTDIRYGFGAGGRVFKIESKDEYRKRHGNDSPDHWDAVVLAFAVKQRNLSAYGWG